MHLSWPSPGRPLAELPEGPKVEEPGIDRRAARPVDRLSRMLWGERDEALEQPYPFDPSIGRHRFRPLLGLGTCQVSL